MSNTLDKVIDILIAAFIMFIIPTSYFMMKKDVIIQVGIEKSTDYFCENVAAQGYISKNMYERYLDQLDNSGKFYNISLTHQQLVHEPEYIIRTSSQVIEEDEDIWEGVNEYNEEDVHTDPPHIEDPIGSTDNLNTETNESILEKSIDNPADPNHQHDDACYSGEMHIHSPSGGDCYGWSSHNHTEPACYTYVYHEHSTSCRHSHSASCYTSFSCNGSAVYSHSGPGNAGSRICPDCGKNHHDSTSDFYICADCGAGMGRVTHRPSIYCCGNMLKRSEPTSDSSYSLCNARKQILTCQLNTMDNYCGKTRDTIEEKTLHCTRTGSYSLKCGKSQGAYYNGDTRVYKACDQIVTNIIPTHPNQTIYINDQLITTVRAIYVDGSEKTVVADTTYSTSNIVDNKSVILSYTLIVDGVTIRKTTTINISVIPRTNLCGNGHTYNINSDGSYFACPYCAGLLKSLSIEEPYDGKLTMYRDASASLQDKGLVLVAEYLDGHMEYVYSGYEDNLLATYVGVQTVTIGYKGLYTSLDVEILRNRRKCDLCALYYDLYIDDRDPGCPYCRAKVPIFTGHVMEYYKETHKEEILNNLYTGEGKYYFNRGDRFEVNTEELEIRKRYSGYYLPAKAHRTDSIKDELIVNKEVVNK